MRPKTIIQKLATNRLVFQHLLDNTSEELRFFRPTARSWCLVEVACHLLDEEVEDFRERVNHILTTPHLPLRPISPDKWPLQRGYLQQEYGATLNSFLMERQKSVEWLSTLEAPDWQKTVDHPDVGPRSAKKFLVNWLAHDYQHIRQINNIHHAYLKYSSGDDLTYAGNW